ncbi:MAG TPA: IgGFc-binding protein [Kofleriaceae bacterium]|nr:IgGFc-binding protein [Kofleriaceae bacterium]
MFQRAFVVAIAVNAIACGPNNKNNGDGDAGGSVCTPGNRYCDPANDHQVIQCNDDGQGTTVVETCNNADACLGGTCVDACSAADGTPSSVGCHFFAVDLDNEAVKTQFGITNDATAQQFSVVVANVNDYPVRVDVFENDAPYGQPLQEKMVSSSMISANDVKQIDLPQREVDGTMGQTGGYAMDMNGTTGTFVSSRAYKIDSTGPVVAVQFNPIVQQFSNDASLLLPRNGIGMHYTTLGWPTSNPCGAPPGDMSYMQSIPDHTFVTILGVQPDTHVTVIPAHPVKAAYQGSGVAIPQTPKGTPMQFSVGPYDVVNLESDQPQVSIFDCLNHVDQDGDFTGTKITSDKPVMVFTGNERGNGTGGANPPPPPGWDNETCCTDHLEEQLLPTEAWGKKFVVSRSPVRSTGGYEEPDLYRVLAWTNGTQVTTSLPAPFDHFTLDAGQWKTLYAYGGFTVQADNGAIQVGQYLVSQGLTANGIGDPSFTIFPAIDQFRQHYVFLVPTTFQDNYMVVSMPVGSHIELDGSVEFPPTCTQRDIGEVDGKMYRQWTCRLEPGPHKITTDEAAQLIIYGYYNVGSYAFLGGSNVNIINPIL